MPAVKKLVRVLGVVGGVAVVVWAMRERLVSIAAPREPEPPKFRVVTATSEPPEPGEDDLTLINGIGPVFSERLQDAGISSFRALSDAGAERAADITGVPISRAEPWIAEAQTRSG
jgi:predicted flap endonuclease-1-like 5' DNA nuclease